MKSLRDYMNVVTEADLGVEPMSDEVEQFNDAISNEEEAATEKLLTDFEAELKFLYEKYVDEAEKIGGRFRSQAIIDELKQITDHFNF